MVRVHEVVKVFDLDPIVPTEEDEGHESFKFRIEVLHDRAAGDYTARVYRHETYRVRPTFPTRPAGEENECWDEELLVRDTAADWEDIRRTTPDEVLTAILEKIADIFGLGNDV